MMRHQANHLHLRGGVWRSLSHFVVQNKPEEASDNHFHYKCKLVSKNVPFPRTKWAVLILSFRFEKCDVGAKVKGHRGEYLAPSGEIDADVEDVDRPLEVVECQPQFP